MQQLREAFPYDDAPRYLIFDRDSIFSPTVVEFVRALGSDPTRTSYRSPGQNGTAERWIGSCRREMLEHIVVVSERHLVRLSGRTRPQFPAPISKDERQGQRFALGRATTPLPDVT